MLVFDIFDFTQNATKVFDAALPNEVINNNGKSYRILPINEERKGKSLLEDVPYITAETLYAIPKFLKNALKIV